jgi:hypothetical protein
VEEEGHVSIHNERGVVNLGHVGGDIHNSADDTGNQSVAVHAADLQRLAEALRDMARDDAGLADADHADAAVDAARKNDRSRVSEYLRRLSGSAVTLAKHLGIELVVKSLIAG